VQVNRRSITEVPQYKIYIYFILLVFQINKLNDSNILFIVDFRFAKFLPLQMNNKLDFEAYHTVIANKLNFNQIQFIGKNDSSYNFQFKFYI
jgi:hypothetical protein